MNIREHIIYAISIVFFAALCKVIKLKIGVTKFMSSFKTNENNINETSKEWFKANINKDILRELSKRSDFQGWSHVILFFAVLCLLGFLCVISWGSWWFIPIYLFYCTLWGGADAIWHECGHRTAFKSRKANDFFYYIAGFMNNFEPIRWRCSHALHHNYTGSIDPHDFEADVSIFWNPKNLIQFFSVFIPGLGLFNLHKSLHREIIEHAIGKETMVMKHCIPESKKRKCIFISRIFTLCWLGIILWAIFVKSLLPIFLLLIPKFFATLNTVWGLTQHIGLRENVKDHRLSTRTITLNPIFSFIYWQMEYHVEHHMYPSVPSHNLPKLHEVIKDQLPKPQNLFEAYKKIIPAILKKSKNPKYFIEVELPKNQDYKNLT